jgi:hypothetical protein
MNIRDEQRETETGLNLKKKTWSAPTATRLDFPKTAASHFSAFTKDSVYNAS